MADPAEHGPEDGRGRDAPDRHDERPATKRTIILRELRNHAPFTAVGALSGIALMTLVATLGVPRAVSQQVFHVMHPAHVLLSAIVTAALYRRYKKHLLMTIVIGYVGSVGIGTLSDIVMPHLGGLLIGARMGVEADPHDGTGHDDADHEERGEDDEHGHHGHGIGHMHIGFIEHWWLVNPLALLGIAIAIWRPTTKLPHSGHMFISTWASLFYLTGYGEASWLPLLPAIFAVLFLAVWVPCCLSDIVFPLLFVGDGAAAEHAHEH